MHVVGLPPDTGSCISGLNESAVEVARDNGAMNQEPYLFYGDGEAEASQAAVLKAMGMSEGPEEPTWNVNQMAIDKGCGWLAPRTGNDNGKDSGRRSDKARATGIVEGEPAKKRKKRTSEQGDPVEKATQQGNGGPRAGHAMVRRSSRSELSNRRGTWKSRDMY